MSLDNLPTLAEVEALRRGKPLAKSRPRALDKDDRDAKLKKFDDDESKEVKKRSKGQCEVFVVGEGRCTKNGHAIHHMLSGNGRRARGESAKAERKQHVCDGPRGHHRLITGNVLRLLKSGDLPRFDDAYERAK